MPPVPPNITMLALEKDRFHCPQILFACHAITQGSELCEAAVTRKTPKYWIPDELVQAIRHKPQILCRQFHIIKGPRERYLSPSQPSKNMNAAANK
jgi:hypothetical protein